MVAAEHKSRQKRNVLLAALAVVAVVQLFGSARHGAPGGRHDPDGASAATAAVRGRAVREVGGSAWNSSSGANGGAAEDSNRGWSSSSSSGSRGITVSGATQITAAGALPLTVMDWADVEHRNDTCDVIRRWAGELPRSTGAVLIHNSAPDWAASTATMESISAYADYWGQVIVAPGGSKRFTIFNNSTKLAQTAAQSRDPSRLPSYMVMLPFRDFADRLRGKVTAPSLVYEGQQESLYFQAEPPQQFNVQQELEKPPVSCLLKPIHPATLDADARPEFRIVGPRLRVTAPHSTHVLHYDMSPTFLLQLRGRKRVRLIAESQLPHIYPYETDHLLARRGRVDLDHPDYDRYPGSRLLQPVDVVMGPGDVMMFPRCTAHTTTSLSEQISLSFRLSPKPNQVLADRRKVAGKTAGKGAALANAMRQAGKAELSPATAAARDVGANQPAAAVLVNGATAGAAAAAS